VSLTNELESELHSINARLRQARQGLSTGNIVDLAPIEQDVKALCHSVQKLPASESQGLRPRLMGTLEEVNQLGENLRAGLGELAQLIGESSERRKALSAYSAPKG
jgi:hypothetical protein